MLTVITVTLVILATVNVLFTAWATVLNASRASALMRALGASSQQVSVGLVAAQVFSALTGVILGVPLGIGLFAGVSRGEAVQPSALWLAATALGTLLAVAGLTAIPARIGTRQPAAEILPAETA
jgi:putative ABC transport system permease protein